MKLHLAPVVVLLLACSMALAQSPDLTLAAPTIVILHEPLAVISKHDDGGKFAKFATDFEANANRMAVALRQHPEISVIYSSAAKVSFGDTGVNPVRREDIVSHWGFVFYRPGSPPVVYAGVVEDTYLVCQAAKYFAVRFDGFKCSA